MSASRLRINIFVADVAGADCGNAQASWCSVTAAAIPAAAIIAITATSLAPGPSSSRPFGPCGATDGPRHAHHMARSPAWYTCCCHALWPKPVCALSVSPLMGMLHCPTGFH